MVLPTDFADLVTWIGRQDSDILTNNPAPTDVFKWIDASGLGGDYISPSVPGPSNNPELTSENGRSAVKFNSASRRLQQFTLYSPHLFDRLQTFLVYRWLGADGQSLFGPVSPSGNSIYAGFNNDAIVCQGQNGPSTGPCVRVAPSGERTIIIWTQDGGIGSSRQTVEASGSRPRYRNTGTGLNFESFQLGGSGGNGSHVLCEAFAFNAIRTDDESDDLVAYLADKWATASVEHSFPSGIDSRTIPLPAMAGSP